MIEKNSRLVSALSSTIEREYKLYAEYLKVLEEERTCLSKFNAEKVTDLSDKRETLSIKISDARDARMELLKVIPDSDKRPLSEIVTRDFHPDDARKLMPLVAKLKEVVKQAQAKGREFNQVVNFSLNVVTSTLSIFWSATQTVTRSYGPQGVLKESLLPAATTRYSGVLREA